MSSKKRHIRCYVFVWEIFAALQRQKLYFQHFCDEQQLNVWVDSAGTQLSSG